MVPAMPSIPDRIKGMRSDLSRDWVELETRFEKWRQDLQMVLQRDPSSEIVNAVDRLKTDAVNLAQAIVTAKAELMPLITAAGTTPDLTAILERLRILEQVVALLSTVESYVHVQATPAAVWTINHPMNRRPSVTVTDDAEEVVGAGVRYISDDVVEVFSNGAYTGKAFLN